MQLEGTSVNVMLIGQIHSFTQLQEQRYCQNSDRTACVLLRVVPSEEKVSGNGKRDCRKSGGVDTNAATALVSCCLENQIAVLCAQHLR